MIFIKKQIASILLHHRFLRSLKPLYQVQVFKTMMTFAALCGRMPGGPAARLAGILVRALRDLTARENEAKENVRDAEIASEWKKNVLIFNSFY